MKTKKVILLKLSDFKIFIDERPEAQVKSY